MCPQYTGNACPRKTGPCFEQRAARIAEILRHVPFHMATGREPQPEGASPLAAPIFRSPAELGYLFGKSFSKNQLARLCKEVGSPMSSGADRWEIGAALVAACQRGAAKISVEALWGQYDHLKRAEEQELERRVTFGRDDAPPASQPPAKRRKADAGSGTPRLPAEAARGEEAPTNHGDEAAATRRMAAWIHACGGALAEKLHGPTGLVHVGTDEFTQHSNWELHQRLEINTRLDGVSREVVYEARRDPDDVKLQKCWLTRLLLNKLGARARVETDYEKRVGRSLYEGDLVEQELSDALAEVKLDNATRGMRMAQWNTVSKKRGQAGEQDQRKLCATLWAELRRKSAFHTAIERLVERVPLDKVLRETLCVHNAFLGMLVARDLAVLLPTLVSKTDVEACTVVGEPAEAVLVECTAGPSDGKLVKSRRDKKGVWRFSAACRKTFARRLKSLHENLRRLLDPKLLDLVVPQGWTLDLTENACCELRRLDKAPKHRKRGMALRSERQQKRLVQLRATWRQLGFTTPPKLCAPVEICQ